jgi:HAD superfamily hydrolase (TIGR01459 family)
MSLRIIGGIGELAADYDGLILDLWGVLHDGSRPFPGAVEALERLKAAGKRRVILSNAPRRAAMVAERLTEIGIPASLYDAIHSSGEEAWLHLKQRDDPFFRALGRRCYFIGPHRDDPLMTGLDYQRVESVADADFLLAVGPSHWEGTIEPFKTVLDAARRRGLPMVCANADLVVMHKGRRSICAGAMAEYYERIGGAVRWHGKPYPSVYEFCFKRLGELGAGDRWRILAVGDSLRTDIAGANRAGIDGLLVTGGIHAEEFGLDEGEQPDLERLGAAIAASGHRPIAVIARLSW